MLVFHGVVQVIVDQLGACGSSFDQFVAALPENQCRYASMLQSYCIMQSLSTVVHAHEFLGP